MSGRSSDVVIVLDDEHDQSHNRVHDEDESITISHTDQLPMMINNTNDYDDDDELRKKNKRSNSWHKLGRCDSLEVESGKVGNNHQHHRHGHAGSKAVDWSTILHLAFQSIGVIYGDIGTSPLYVYASTFTDGIKHNDDILGVLSLILYTITLIPVIKYIFIVLRATDNGEGGTFALYSLICRYAKVGLIPSQQAEDRDVSNYQLESPNDGGARRASNVKSKLENSLFSKYFLLFATMLGTSMVIGDGVLTPCISVLSAVGGIKEATSFMTEDRIVWVSIAILICLFLVQRFGTDKVGYCFAPLICIWFAFIAGVGLYNFIKYDLKVIKALNPKYIIDYFQRNKKQAWVSLGGVVLAVTGTEALFADVGHFNVLSIQISMCAVTYPSLVLAYIGQASYLRQHNDQVANTFYESIPGSFYWPMFVVAVCAAIIASQAMISGTFSIIQQSLSLGCFPRVKVVHTSAKYAGQVYIPEVNYLLMLACVAVTAGFRTTAKIGNAYGIAVVFVMTLTSSFLVLIMIVIWKTHILLVISFVLLIGSVELLYLSSVLYKFDQGGYLPLAFAAVLVTIMYVWNYVYRMKYNYELNHKVSPEKVKEITDNTKLCRMPGLAMFYSELVHGIPPIFEHYVANVPALHSVLVFVSIKSLPISKVAAEDRFLFRRVKPCEFNVFRCVVRYGYTDVRNQHESFERMLVDSLKGFIAEDLWLSEVDSKNGVLIENRGDHEDNADGHRKPIIERQYEDKEELEMVEHAWRAGVVHLIGENEVVARKGSGLAKKILINYAFNFLRRNLRQSEKVFEIPHKRLLKVGMTYEL
ncbi:potassium transporter 5-like [Papaver somniferum]|uniref:potassium transporter 5-like n=1 Tax=Papaver somniferum TaxID=3469 RepID=UPI000E7056F4|nr:potassium transporter 5-like [Papaver somniferum]